ncbi:transposase [Micromonosporaceae bacterium Da 78-11]
MGRQRVYPSNLTDAQWEIIEPMLPLIKEPGRIPKHPFRDILDAILYIDRSGCSWRQLPVDFPPWQTVYGWFGQWKARGATERIMDELREQIRLAEGRGPQPSAGVIDSQSVKGADTVGSPTARTVAGWPRTWRPHWMRQRHRLAARRDRHQCRSHDPADAVARKNGPHLHGQSDRSPNSAAAQLREQAGRGTVRLLQGEPGPRSSARRSPCPRRGPGLRPGQRPGAE